MTDLDLRINVEGEEQLAGMGDALGDASDSLVDFGNIASGLAVGGGLALLGGALTTIGTHAFNMSADIEDATQRARTQLGLSADEAERFEGVMENIFENNFGESFEDIGQALTTVEQQFARIGGVENESALQRVTEQAFGIADAFDKDINETVSAAVTLMDTFGLSSDQAMGFVISGLQRGLDSSGDFLDTIGEYSGQFSGAGADAGEFFSILETGMQGGVLGTDKVADAFKEFTLRISDDSDTTREALDAIGIDYDTLTAGISDGSITQIDAFNKVIEGIRLIEDPIERDKVAFALFGTQVEDSTVQMLLDLDSTKTGVEDIEGATEDLDDQYDTTRANWEAASKKMQAAMIPIGDSLREIGGELLPYVADFIEQRVVPAIDIFAKGVGTLSKNWDAIYETIKNLGPLLQGLPFVGPLLGSLNAPTMDDYRGLFGGGGSEPPAPVYGEPRVEVTGPEPVIAPRVRPMTERERLLNNVPVTWPADGSRPVNLSDPSTYPSGMSVTNNFYGNPNADDVSTGIVEGTRAIGIRE